VTRIGDRLDSLALGGGRHACDRAARIDRSVGGVCEWKFGRGERSGLGDRLRHCRRPAASERSGAYGWSRAHDARDRGGVVMQAEVNAGCQPPRIR
jgi:hypothetical protein